MMELTKENIRKYARLYEVRFKNTDDERTESEAKNWLKNHRYDREHFIRVGLWKTPRQRKRYESNDELTVREVAQFSFRTKSEKARIESLFVLEGVGYPVASAILHFAFPNIYPILDFRVLESLGIPQPNNYDFDFWQKYCKRVWEISEKTGESIRTIDKTLWEYSKRHPKK